MPTSTFYTINPVKSDSSGVILPATSIDAVGNRESELAATLPAYGLSFDPFTEVQPYLASFARQVRSLNEQLHAMSGKTFAVGYSSTVVSGFTCDDPDDYPEQIDPFGEGVMQNGCRPFIRIHDCDGSFTIEAPFVTFRDDSDDIYPLYGKLSSGGHMNVSIAGTWPQTKHDCPVKVVRCSTCVPDPFSWWEYDFVSHIGLRVQLLCGENHAEMISNCSSMGVCEDDDWPATASGSRLGRLLEKSKAAAGDMLLEICVEIHDRNDYDYSMLFVARHGGEAAAACAAAPGGVAAEPEAKRAKIKKDVLSAAPPWRVGEVVALKRSAGGWWPGVIRQEEGKLGIAFFDTQTSSPLDESVRSWSDLRGSGEPLPFAPAAQKAVAEADHRVGVVVVKKESGAS